jgi:hypothetical protein
MEFNVYSKEEYATLMLSSPSEKIFSEKNIMTSCKSVFLGVTEKNFLKNPEGQQIKIPVV